MFEFATTDVSIAGREAQYWAPSSLAPLNQEGRILAALGQSRGPLPRVATKWLCRYHDYLSRTLAFPFEARCPEESGSLRPWTAIVSVIELLPPTNVTNVDDAGILCKALVGRTKLIEVPLIDLEVAADHANSQLIEDYWYWFWNWRFDPQI